MECLQYMDYKTFINTFGDIYKRYKMTRDPEYAYFSVYPMEYIQIIQQIVFDDFNVTMGFFRYIDKMICDGKISEDEYSKIIKHAYFVFANNFRDSILNEDEYDNIFKSIELLISQFE